MRTWKMKKVLYYRFVLGWVGAKKVNKQSMIVLQNILYFYKQWIKAYLPIVRKTPFCKKSYFSAL